MRKYAVLFVVIFLLFSPVVAQAQSPVLFKELYIQFWPDYDQPSVLVIYDFIVSEETPLPAQVNVRMPSGAQLLAVAKDEGGQLMIVEHDLPTQVGNYSVVSFFVADRLTYRVEFYIPYDRQDHRRTFLYAWTGDYAVDSLTMLLQEPLGATDIMTEPTMNSIGAQPDGFTYRSFSAEHVKEGDGLSLKVSYNSASDTTFAGKPQPAAPLTPSQPLASFLPWILGGIGLVLILGGGLWYWLSGRSDSAGAGRKRKRRAAQVEESPAAAVYCSQCGKRAQPEDRFCRACGAKLRQ